jgi:hypothetical protein
MSLEEFSQGHKGAAGTPVELGLGSALTPEQDAAARRAKSSEVSESRPVYIPGATAIPGSRESSLPAGARFPEEYENTPKGRNRKALDIIKGVKIIGETHDIEGNPLKNTLLEKAAEPINVTKQVKAAPKGSVADSEYEATLRNRMPYPGATNATKSQRAILSDTQSNVKVLNDHWNTINESIGDNTSHPLYAVHKQIGGMIALAQHSLNQATSSKSANTVQVTNVHLRAATDAIHTANEQMHKPDYYINAGSLPPVGTAATDVPRAHALVEHAVPSDKTNLPKYIKLGRGGSSKLENNQATFERLYQLNKEIDAGKHPGLNKQLARRTLAFATKGTPKGGAEYGPTNPGPMTVGNNDMGSAFDTIGFAGARPTSLGAGITPGSAGNLVKGKKVNFLYVHPDAIPSNAVIGQHKTTGQRWAFVDGKPVDKLPTQQGKKLVEYGKHVGQKVVDSNGFEVPHLNEKGKPLSFKELVQAGAMHTTSQDVDPAPSSPNAPAPKPEAKPAPRNWDTLPPRKRAAINTRVQAKTNAAQAAAADIDEDLEDRRKLVEHAYQLSLQEKEEKAATASVKKTTSRKKKTDAETIAEAALLGITRRGAN